VPFAPPRLVRFSTDMLPERDRMSAFREAFARQILNMDVVNHTAGRPRLNVRLLKIGPVGVGGVDGTAAEFIRDARHVKDGTGDLQLLLIGSGQVHAHHAGREFRLGIGEAALFDYARPLSAHGGDGGAATNIFVPPGMLRALVRHPEDQAGRPILPRPALRLLQSYLVSLAALDEPPSADLGLLIGQHLLDLFAAVLGPTAEGREIIRDRGLKAARLRAVLADIGRRFGNPGLDVDSAAGRLGLSRRSVQRLLEETGRSFTEHVTEHRLERAQAMLADPDCAHMRIVEIALAVGFGDVAHFNRLYRRRFGDTPSGARSAGRRKGPG
jgi:AraC-like DNA-binding protein